ncbi:MAG: DUF4349 domain-containing protein [Candidatus Dojkabacteria bacterium]|jgi:hypothetical protein
MALSKKAKTILIVSSVIFSILVVALALFLIYGVKEYFAPSFYKEEAISFNEGRYPVSEGLSLDSYQRADSRTLEADNYYEANIDSKIKKSGSVDIKVESLDESYKSLKEIMGGYQATIVSSYDAGEGNKKSVSTTIKIKSEYFEDIYEDVKQVEGEVLYASYYTDDVTMEYTDLESRLKNLVSTEIQLVKILDTAKTVEDTLAVYTELTDIRSQIEVIEGQLKYLDSQVDYSYLTVNLSLSDLGKDIRDEQWKPLGVAKNAFSSLVDFGIYLADILIWVIIFSPVIAIAVITVILIKKKAKKSK